MDEKGFDSGSNLILLENLPEVAPLTIVELKKITQSNIGLRSTTQKNADLEMKEGVEGDFILLSNLSHHVDISDEVLNKFMEQMGNLSTDSFQIEMFTSILAQGAITGKLADRFKEIVEQIDISQVPERFTKALGQFISKRALPSVPYQITNTMTVNQYLDDLITKATPAMLILKYQDEIGYDHQNYCGFNKRGRGFILHDQFIKKFGITLQNVELLKKRYGQYLQSEFHPSGSKGLIGQLLANQLDRDVESLLLGNTISTIRETIQ